MLCPSGPRHIMPDWSPALSLCYTLCVRSPERVLSMRVGLPACRTRPLKNQVAMHACRSTEVAFQRADGRRSSRVAPTTRLWNNSLRLLSLRFARAGSRSQGEAALGPVALGVPSTESDGSDVGCRVPRRPAYVQPVPMSPHSLCHCTRIVLALLGHCPLRSARLHWLSRRMQGNLALQSDRANNRGEFDMLTPV